MERMGSGQGGGDIVAIPTSMASIGDRAFRGCSALASVAIPASVTSIEYGAFRGCSSLTRVAISPSVTRIERNAFSGCSSLISVEIPASVTTLGGAAWQGGPFYGAFEGCTSLAVLMVQPIDPDDDSDDAAAATDAATSITAAGRTPSRADGHLAPLAGRALAVHVWLLEARPATDNFSAGFLT